MGFNNFCKGFMSMKVPARFNIVGEGFGRICKFGGFALRVQGLGFP